MESLRGSLLISSGGLYDPNFRHTVVLVGEHNADGALGVVLNRALDVTVQDAIPILSDLVPPGELLFEGPLQGDCYSAHYTLVGKYPKLDLIGCMAHMRRYFDEALELGERRYSPLVIRYIANLYAVERWLGDHKAGPALREAVRTSQSAPILRRLHRILESIRGRTLPAGALGKAVNYALNHWERIAGYLKDGRLVIDNNAAERAVRPTKLGMRNWLFIGNAEAGWAAAVMYTLAENCKRHGLDPYGYLKDVLTRLPEGDLDVELVAHLTPARIAGVRPLADRSSAA